MDVARLRAEAERLRRLARGVNDAALVADLERLAREIEARIGALMNADPDRPTAAR